ncbi:SMC-Scp complex subunit ScpB [Alloscardovia criceti]|uniref:SMC-Scp complex subunit ScpB n=1 Tax=Alloscardovia criceti TaxID=356828 RepID=UPI00035DC800|nr:SMC-Scp complex subunit ScpB [Alloscardovia criceti]
MSTDDKLDIKPALEAIFMASDQALTVSQLAAALSATGYMDEAQDAESRVEQAIDELSAEYAQQGRGFELVHTAQGWQYMTAQAYENVVAQFITDGQTARLSQAALETLAIIAYKQPITRAQVTAIRGVSSDGVIRSLMVRGLIRENGLDEETHAALLETTVLFLDKMGLTELSHLPLLAPFLPSSVPDEKDL